MAKIVPCQEPDCERPKAKPKHRCYWHALLHDTIEGQVEEAKRRKRARHLAKEPELASVPKGEWPPGERWCAGCQSFVPLFYASGSRCRACTSEARHAQHVKAEYGIAKEDYDALWEFQGGRCYVCQRQARSKRLAVDHDHATGAVRGLLCADSDRGCNHAILGNITSLEMARRIPEYLEDPPFARFKRGESPRAVHQPPPPARAELDERTRRSIIGTWTPDKQKDPETTYVPRPFIDSPF